MKRSIERRRTIRIRRSSLLEARLEDLDRPSIKIAETLDEYIQSFRLVHDEYLAQGYIPVPESGGMSYNLYNFLPKTCIFIFKSYLDVLSTLTYVPDNDVFGLPMDTLYKPEVDELRARGRKVVELGALATVRSKRWRNILMMTVKAMFHYAKFTRANDLCITVNPKHVRFYKNIFLFEDFGEERFFEKVGAPAVALRVSFDNIEEKLAKTYGGMDFDTDLHGFFVQMNRNPMEPDIPEYQVERRRPLEYEVARHLLANKPELLCDFKNEEQARYFEGLYHKALYAPTGVARVPCAPDVTQ
ncbi:N-acyl amino acid synthase FeeM domain-containing protein [Desulfohalovibrio reitneri]|uniref:N-acyl amino acid synthase FeeM domain-containing protein n=1 Tax=Desulfohalovibrio reitneri TaxID=1307759 RepID=UPI000557C928|nr:hypothetical protein [Desulfohalovibrio reitneri]